MKINGDSLVHIRRRRRSIEKKSFEVREDPKDQAYGVPVIVPTVNAG